MSSLVKTFHWHTMFEGIVSGFLGFFDGKVSVNVFEKIFIEKHFSRPFSTISYTFL